MSRCRTVLSVPGSSPRMIVKGLDSAADMVFLDLEDSVAPNQKNEARARVAEALAEADWRGRPRSFRCNGLDSLDFYRDLIQVFEGSGGTVDRLIVPKVSSANDVVVVSRLLGQLELATGREKLVQLDLQIETAAGVAACEWIAAADGRISALTFGPGDFAASAGFPAVGIGVSDQWDEIYPGHRWHYPMARIAVAARAFGIEPIDGPYADYRDSEGLRRSALMARSIGYSGKWCIHPDQIAAVNEVFTPSAEEIAAARHILLTLANAAAAGLGAAGDRSLMIDAASARMARRTLETAGLDPNSSQ